MILAIFLLAAILLIAGGVGLVSAIGLVPTDLGFTYFQSGTIALSAGMIVLALGFAVATLDRSFRRLATPAAIRVSAPVSEPEARPEISAPEVSSPEALAGEAPAAGDQPMISPAGMVLAGAAAGALATAAVSAAGSDTAAADAAESTSPHPVLTAPEKLLEDFERDLFTGIKASPPPLDLLAAPPLMTDAGIGRLANGDRSQEDVQDVWQAATHDAPDGPPADPLPADPLPVDPLLVDPFMAAMDAAEPGVAKDGGVEPGIAIEPETVIESKAVDEAKIDDESRTAMEAAMDMVIAPVASETMALAEAEPESVPGLIDDADLAAVSDGQLPPLAPISGLEVVGSYDSAGTRFTMYSDGSVIAAGPQGDRRFRSLDELRRHLDAGLA